MQSDTNVYERLKKSPLRTEQTAFNNRLDKIFKKMPSDLPKRFKAYLPTLPFMKLSPKIHKPTLCFRPIISQSQAFTKTLAQHLSKILTPLLGTFSTAHLLNSTQLKQRLLEEADPNLPFLSLDVESLFTNVPLTPLLDFLYRKYQEGRLPLPDGYTIEGLLDLIRLCVDSTVFSFNGKYYRQKQGVSMGSPLAPVLACLYMEYFETELRQTIQGHQPSFWVRYIDDILLQWSGSYDEFKIFLNQLTQVENLIKLQVEWETTDPIQPDHATIPFLDLYIKRSPSGFFFSVYRKPTATDLYTHYYSSHPLSTKRGVLIGLFLRGYRLCSPEALPGEIQHLRSIFRRLKYPEHVINQALSKAKRKFNSQSVREQPKSKYHLTVEYYPTLEPVQSALNTIGVNTVFSSKNTLGSLLSKTGPKRPQDEELPGVYKVECKQCPEGVYYGETGVTVPKRMAGHKTDIREANDSNALFAHMRDNPGHSFDHKGAKLIFTSNQKSKRQLVESALIATKVNCNLKPGDFPVCRITAPVVLKGVKLDKPRATPNTATSSISAPIMPTPTVPQPATTTPTPATSNLTQALSNLAITSHKPSPVAKHTRSHHCTLVSASPAAFRSPFPAQSQARALPASQYTLPVASPVLSHFNSPVVRKTYSHTLLSQCHSPNSSTGATRKRRFVCNIASSPDIFSPMAKRLRSSKVHK